MTSKVGFCLCCLLVSFYKVGANTNDEGYEATLPELENLWKEKLALTDALLESLTESKQEMESTLQRLAFKEKILDLKLVEDRTRQRRQFDNEENVAFYALMNNFTEHAPGQSRLRFERALTNKGQGYNPSTGLFTAPVPGIYVFSVTLMSDPGHFNKYHLYTNDVAFANIVSDARDTSYSTSSQTFVLYLSASESVSVHIADSDGFVHGHGHSSFCGFLQQQDFSAGSGTVIGR